MAFVVLNIPDTKSVSYLHRSNFFKVLFSASNASILAKRAVLTATLVVSDGPGIDGVLHQRCLYQQQTLIQISDKEGSSCT